MIAANKARKASRPARAKHATPRKPQARKTMARRRRRYAAPRAPRATRRRRSFTRAAGPRAGFASVPLLVGTVIGAGAAIGSGVLLQMAANAAKFELPQAVKDYAPLAGAGVVAGLAMLAPKWKALTMPALIGGAAVVALNMFLSRNTPPAAKGYYRLTGSGNVARTINATSGAGNVARTINASAA